MKVLFVAPLPPPISGQSIVSEKLFNAIEVNHSVMAVNMNKSSHVDGIDGFKRIKEVVGMIRSVAKKQKTVDRIYLQISESIAGNLKDLFFFYVCRKNLDKMYIHLHGGTIKSNVYERYSVLRKINKYFISKMGGVIISGKSHIETFSDKIDESKIKIVPNFAAEELFFTKDHVDDKFKKFDPINILYMSALIPLKGYLLLLEALKKWIKRCEINLFLILLEDLEMSKLR